MTGSARLELLWLPLGAGGSPLVRLGGRVYESLTSRREGRAAVAIYHAALRVHVGEAEYVVEVAPAWDHGTPPRGVVAGGPVGSRLLGRSILFRYAVRCWRDGTIPDEAYAVGGPVDVETDRVRARRLVARVADVPTPVWGRDELGAGEMWNSNSVVSWLLVVSGHAVPRPPAGGRAPGWQAGVEVAHRSAEGVPPPVAPLFDGRAAEST